MKNSDYLIILELLNKARYDLSRVALADNNSNLYLYFSIKATIEAVEKLAYITTNHNSNHKE